MMIQFHSENSFTSTYVHLKSHRDSRNNFFFSLPDLSFSKRERIFSSVFSSGIGDAGKTKEKYL